MKYASFKMWIADKYHYKDGYAILKKGKKSYGIRHLRRATSMG